MELSCKKDKNFLQIRRALAFSFTQGGCGKIPTQHDVIGCRDVASRAAQSRLTASPHLIEPSSVSARLNCNG
jgi:hypothetical protein